jgi:3-oxoadipate enol-lactonase
VATPSWSGTIEAGGLDLWLERTGSGPPLILLHGLADDHRLWRRVVPRIADLVETIAVDLPGHGRSGQVPAGASLDWFAARILALVDALGLPAKGAARPVLAGLSMGGGVTQYAALAAPGRFRALVLISTSPVHPPATRERFRVRAEAATRGGMAAVADATVARWFTPRFMAAEPGAVAETTATVLATDPASFAAASYANADRDCLERLREIDVPVLFVGGLEDPAGPVRAAGLYRDRIRDIRIELLEDASHLVPIEAADRLVPILRSFLESLPGTDE